MVKEIVKGDNYKMKKRVCLFVLFLALAVTGCAKGEGEPEGEGQTKELRQSQSMAEPEGQQEIVDSGAEYLGAWTVTENIIYAPVSAFSSEEAEELVGNTLIYDADKYTWEDMVFNQTVYEETAVTKEEFLEDYNNRLTFADLGLSDGEVTLVSVGNSYEFGSSFYIKDENTLIISCDGAFFEAVRK